MAFDISKNTYVNQLPVIVQEIVIDVVSHRLYMEECIAKQDQDEYIQDALDSRLGDLEEVLDVDELIKNFS